MAGLKNADDFASGERFNADSLKNLLLMVGGGALVLFFIIALFQPETKTIGDEGPEYSPRGAMAYSYLFGVVFFMTLTIGGIFWTLLHNASNSGWGTVVRRLMENLGSVFIFVLILGAPLVFWSDFRDNLWEWIPERDAIVTAANHEAEAEWADRKAGLEESKAGAEQAFGALEAKITTELNKATPGEAHFLNVQLAAERAKLDHLLEEDLSEDAVKGEIVEEFFHDHHHGNLLLWNKRGYLNLGAWVFRFFLYGIALGGVIFCLRFWSLKQDQTGDPKYFRWMRRAACGFLPVFAASWTFLVIDWLMALDYTWFSTMWGVYLFAGSAQASMAFLIILLTLLRKQGYLKKVVTMEHYHLMGKLLLAFTIFWAYIAFSQFFLIWYANITEETKFYLTRNTDYWNTYTIVCLVIGHFFIPFGILLIQQWKKVPVIISGVSGWILLMHFLDLRFMIVPERGPTLTGGEAMTIPGYLFCDLLAWIGVGCLFGYFLLRQLSNASLFPCRDPRLDESLNVVN